MPIGMSASSACAGTCRLASGPAPSAARPPSTCRRLGLTGFGLIMVGTPSSLLLPGRALDAGSGGEAAVIDLQRVVETVVEAGKRDPQRQLDELRLAEVLAQPREHSVAGAAGPLG